MTGSARSALVTAGHLKTPLVDGPATGSLRDFIAGIPKAEIHVHHVGSASPRIVSERAARHPGLLSHPTQESSRAGR